MPFDLNLLEHFPDSPGIYIMKNESGKVLYVGKAKSLKKRLKQYFGGKDTRPTIPHLLSELSYIETLMVPTEKEALLVENTFIKKYQPKYNLVLKDDKTYASLRIDPHHLWPRLQLVRYKQAPQDGALYFGPYTSAFAARETLELMSRLFPLRQCSDEELKRRTRPCLLYAIHRCLAPCVHQCSSEEYLTHVQGAIAFLQGNNKKVLQELQKEMEKAAEQLEFEKAAALLRTIRQIEHVTQTRCPSYRASGKATDVIGLYREGEEILIMQLIFRHGKIVGSEHFHFSEVLEEDEELLSTFLLQHYPQNTHPPEQIFLPFLLQDENSLLAILQEKLPKLQLITPRRGDNYALVEMAQENAKATFSQIRKQAASYEKLLLDLQEALHLNRYPKQIECFDMSNLAGHQPVASMVTFTDGSLDKKKMRLFHIKGIHKPDDYAALHQVLTRRLSRAKEEDTLPDLIIVDGGKGQLNIGIEVLRELDIANVDLICVTKEEGRHDRGITLERVFIPGCPDPISLPYHSPLLLFLQKVRDTAHDQAIRFHRKTRSKQTIKSVLDTLPGIGPIKKRRLLQTFGSLQKILEASDEELLQVRGITQKDLTALRKLQK